MSETALTPEQRVAASDFLGDNRGWGFGVSVITHRDGVAAVPGRYGWVGGTGTSAHVVPATGTVAVLLTQREMSGPTPTTTMRAFWRHAQTLR